MSYNRKINFSVIDNPVVIFQYIGTKIIIIYWEIKENYLKDHLFFHYTINDCAII